MSDRHYSKAPIIEAVVDIQVELPSDFSSSNLTELAEKLSANFPIQHPLALASVQIGVNADFAEGESPQVSSTHSDIGLRLTNSDNSRVLQLKTFGFSYSHLPPYSRWKLFRKEAVDYWNLFVDHCKPVKITRCAVRYINRIDIPHPSIAIEEYLNIFPQFPETISQDVNGMQMRLEMPQSDLECMAIINEAVVDPAISDGFSIIVDIDIFKMMSINPVDVEIWDYLDKLRVRKNELFEAFITDKTRELIR